MPQHLREYIIELADRFPDFDDDQILQAGVDYWPGAIAYRRSMITLYTDSLDL